MKFTTIALALPLTAFAAVIDVSATSATELSPGPPQIRKDATRKFFKFGRELKS
jgi:hypothetical protein